MPTSRIRTLAAVVCLSLLGCSEHRRGVERGPADHAPGFVTLDGSSTVFPVSEAMAEALLSRGGIKSTIGISGTGGGFQRLCRGEVDLVGASRPITQSEMARCRANGERYIELPIAYDGIVVAVHPDNDWVDALTVQELRHLWRPEAEGKITTWADLRPGWPARPIHLYGPGVASGTYDYFTAAIVGREHASRSDFTSSEDDNMLVQGVATDPLALGFFGFAYYQNNRARLKVVAIDDRDAAGERGPVEPGPESIARGSYQPLTRPLFLYVRSRAAERDEVKAFVHFSLTRGVPLVREVGYVPLPAAVYDRAIEHFDARVTGTAFAGRGAEVGVSPGQLLSDL